MSGSEDGHAQTEKPFFWIGDKIQQIQYVNDPKNKTNSVNQHKCNTAYNCTLYVLGALFVSYGSFLLMLNSS